MRESLYFTYDGVRSIDMGLLNVSVSNGMFEEDFLPQRNLKEIQVKGRDTPYFQEVGYSPLEFKLSFAFENKYDSRRIREVARWLNQSYYKPLVLSESPNRIFYCMPINESKLIHNGLQDGYLELDFRCDSPFSYSNDFFKKNLAFPSAITKKIIEQNTFQLGAGLYEDMMIVNNHLEIDLASFKLSKYYGKKWSDIM